LLEIGFFVRFLVVLKVEMGFGFNCVGFWELEIVVFDNIRKG
jgi:hypothetical protein